MLLSGVLFVLFLDGCWLYCLADAALTPASEFRGLSKTAWVGIIIATFIVGAIAWLIARRAWRTKSWATAQVNRTTFPGSSGTDFTRYTNWTAPGTTDATDLEDPADPADEAVARHPADRSKPVARDGWTAPKGPDDDPEFLRLLDRRIRGTSSDSGE